MNKHEKPIDNEWKLQRSIFWIYLYLNVVLRIIFSIRYTYLQIYRSKIPFKNHKDLVFETLIPQFNHAKIINKVSQIMYSISFCAMAFNN